MAKSNKNLHLTLSERQIIQRGIENGSTKTSIAATLGKDKSTIGKEIKAHRKHSHICSFDPACAGTTSRKSTSQTEISLLIQLLFT